MLSLVPEPAGRCDGDRDGLLPAGNLYYLSSITCPCISPVKYLALATTANTLGRKGKPLNKPQSQSKGVSTSNPKSGQLSAKLAAERKKAVSPGGGAAANDDRMMVSLLISSLPQLLSAFRPPQSPLVPCSVK